MPKGVQEVHPGPEKCQDGTQSQSPCRARYWIRRPRACAPMALRLLDAAHRRRYAEKAAGDYGKEGGSPCAVQAADAPTVQTPLFVMRVAPGLSGCANRLAMLTECL